MRARCWPQGPLTGLATCRNFKPSFGHLEENAALAIALRGLSPPQALIRKFAVVFRRGHDELPTDVTPTPIPEVEIGSRSQAGGDGIYGIAKGAFFTEDIGDCWVSAVPLYRFYKLNKAGRVAGLPEAVDCTDDRDAAEKAKQRANGAAIEIWDLARRVAVVGARERKSGQGRKTR